MHGGYEFNHGAEGFLERELRYFVALSPGTA